MALCAALVQLSSIKNKDALAETVISKSIIVGGGTACKNEAKANIATFSDLQITRKGALVGYFNESLI